MKSFYQRLYLSTFITSFGSWLTFLAIAMLVQEKYGGNKVAYTFLVQCIPTLLLSKGFSKIVPEKYRVPAFVATQVLLALNSLVLVFATSMPVIYAHLLMGATLKTLAVPLFNTLIGEWASKTTNAPEKTGEVFGRVGALQTVTLALAPALGGGIAATFGFRWLFLLDAASFVVAVIVLFPVPKRERTEALNANSEQVSLLSSLAIMPRELTPLLRRNLQNWFAFLWLGAFLNACEFYVFEQYHFAKNGVGLIVSAWGFGNLLSFVLAGRLRPAVKTVAFLVVVYGASLCLFTKASVVSISALSFFVGGAAGALLSGWSRGALQTSVPAGRDPLPIWAFVNQITQLMNLICYLSMGLLLPKMSLPWLVLPMLVFAVIYGFFHLRVSTQALSRSASTKL